MNEHELAQDHHEPPSFPSDEALLKLFYSALRDISKNWNLILRDCKAALNGFIIQYEERMPQH